MTHPRNEIRNAVTALLMGSTSAGVRVFPTRKTDHLASELPVISIYTRDEDSELNGNAPRELERSTRLLIECMVQEDENVDDAMDDFAEEVEDIMDADYTLGGLCFESQLVSTDMDSVKDSGRAVGILELTYQIEYRTDAFVAVTGTDAATDYTNTTVVHDLEGNQADADKTSDAFVQEE
jgi:hypothetical protein